MTNKPIQSLVHVGPLPAQYIPRKHSMEEEVSPKQQQAYIRDLEQKLAYAELKVEALETLIDLAEKDGLQIRKNAGAKLSPK